MRNSRISNEERIQNLTNYIKNDIEEHNRKNRNNIIKNVIYIFGIILIIGIIKKE